MPSEIGGELRGAGTLNQFGYIVKIGYGVVVTEEVRVKVGLFQNWKQLYRFEKSGHSTKLK